MLVWPSQICLLKQYLYLLVTTCYKCEMEQKSIVDTFLTKPHIVSMSEKTIKILTPIYGAIVYYQLDKVPISEVYHTCSLSKLPASIASMESKAEIERDYLCRLIKKRMTFLSGDTHGIACHLDPCYVGAGLDVKQRMRIEKMILKHPIGPNQGGNSCNPGIYFC